MEKYEQHLCIQTSFAEQNPKRKKEKKKETFSKDWDILGFWQFHMAPAM